MKFLAGLLASISGFFAGNSSPELQPPPLNTAIVAYQQTYFAPAVAEPGNFPWAKKISVSADVSAPAPKITLPPPAPVLPPAPAPVPIMLPPLPVAPTVSYLFNGEPSVIWLRTTISLGGDGFEPTPRVFENMDFDREYWKINWDAHWLNSNSTAKNPIEKDYFKLEVYEKGTDKLVFSTSSKTDESFRGFQVFQKAGKYYFKTYVKSVNNDGVTSGARYEINVLISSKLAQ